MFIYDGSKESIVLKVNNDILCSDLIKLVGKSLNYDSNLISLKEGKDILVYKRKLSFYKKGTNVILHVVKNPIHYNINYQIIHSFDDYSGNIYTNTAAR